MAETFASGWENPDHHEPASARPRPMFDEQGNPVTEAPPAQPEPEPATWNAPEMDSIMRPGDIQPQAVVPPGQAEDWRLKQIHALAEQALDSDRPGVWSGTLMRIVELAQ